MLNVIVGAANSVGGLIGFDPACNGITDDPENVVQFRPSIWEEDGFMNDVSLLMAYPGSYYERVRKPIEEYKPTDMSMLALQPLGRARISSTWPSAIPICTALSLSRPRLFYGCNPIKWWGNHDEQIEMLKNLDFIVGVDLFLNDPPTCMMCSFLGRTISSESILCLTCSSTTGVICGLDVPWAYPIMQPGCRAEGRREVHFRDNGRSCRSQGMTANYVGLMNMVYRVKDEYSVPMDQPFDLEAFANSVTKSRRRGAWLRVV